jgi:glycosyltransferase involved in cell wall biosynthesis
VASRVGGIVDVIKDEETGLLVREKDPEAIAKAVLRLLENPDFAQRLGEQGCAHAADYFNWDRIIDQYESIYRKCLLSDRERALEEKNAQPVTT